MRRPQYAGGRSHIALLYRLRAEALDMIRNPETSTPSQRELAWTFLNQHSDLFA